METSPRQQEHGTEQLLDVIRQVVVELRPAKQAPPAITLDSALDADLGLDSLGRVELIARLEQHFHATLPQSAFAEVATPRDLLRIIHAANDGHATPIHEPVSRPQAEQSTEQPIQANTLLEVLEWHVRQHPQRLHIRVLEDDAEVATLTYEQLWQEARQKASGLQALGVVPGETVAIMLPTGRDYFLSFIGVLMAGAIPVPIYPPARLAQLEEHLQRHTGILQNCQASTLITVAEAKMVAALLKTRVESLRNVVAAQELQGDATAFLQPPVSGQDTAFLQYTSGSTGNPKGVVLTHANLLANLRAMGTVVKVTSRDVFVSWLPLYHDMGLIGAWFGSLYFGLELVVMSPLAFLAKPQRWLWAIHKYGGTLSASPNFGYELCCKRIRTEDMEGLNLAHWRLAFNGAEQVSPASMAQFTQRFQPLGFRPEAMQPVYGLAEVSLGLAFSDLAMPPQADCVQRETFSRTGKAVAANGDGGDVLRFVNCGQPLPGNEVRIVGEDGRELPERREGHLEFRGPSSTSGYYRNPAATQELFNGDWRRSGDRAYIAGGDIFITGRSKDIIIRAGRNIYPHELEQAVGKLPGVRKGCVAAFGARDQQQQTERLVVMVETSVTDDAARQALQEQITSTASKLLDMPPDEVLLVAPHTVLKTSSGKIRRSACRALYEQGRVGSKRTGLGFQFARLLMASVLPGWRRLWRKAAEQAYAAYVWSLFALLLVVAFLPVILLPAGMRWTVARALLKLLVFASGTRLTVQGLENLPPAEQPCVYVANHASYVDALALIAAVPRNMGYIGKSELGRNPLLRLFLQRMQVEFVERFDPAQASREVERLTGKVQQGRSLLFFAEGTFSRIPGLREFHLGAFVTAAQAGVPVVPLAVRGTRSILRANSWFPHRGQVTVTVGEAISSTDVRPAQGGDGWRTALALRDQARTFIAQHCGEPDFRKGRQ